MELQQATFLEKVAAKAVIILSVIAVVVLLMLLLRSIGVFDATKLRAFIESTGNYGPFVLMGVIVVGSVSLTIPATPAIVLSGILYGPLLGGLYAYIAILFSASIAFFISRYFRKYIIRVLGKHAAVLIRFQEKYVSYVIFVTRAIPFFHFEVVSYASGLTSVSYGAYILATGLGILIPTLIFSSTGALILESSGIFPIISAIIMVLIVFLVPLAIDHYNPWGWKEKLLHAKHAKKRLV